MEAISKLRLYTRCDFELMSSTDKKRRIVGLVVRTELSRVDSVEILSNCEEVGFRRLLLDDSLDTDLYSPAMRIDSHRPQLDRESHCYCPDDRYSFGVI